MTNDYDWFWTKLNKYLANKNLKQTKQRKRIVEFFIDSGPHVSAEDLHLLMKKKGEDTSIATIYRTLNLLKEAQLVEQKLFADGHYIFEVLDPNSHHDHLICQDCNAIIEFQNSEIESLQNKIAEQHGFKLANHHHVLFGDCQRKDCPNR